MARRLATAAGVPALILAFALAAGCGSDADPAPTAPPPPPEPPPAGPPPDTLDLPGDPDHFFLEIWEGPGFVPIEYSLGRPPRYGLTVGGDLFYEGPTIAIFPGPLLPNIRRGAIPDEDLASIIAAAAATGISQVEDDEEIRQPASGPILADVPTLEVLLRDRQGSHWLRVEAFGSIAHTDPRVVLIRGLMDLLDEAAAGPGFDGYAGDRIQVYWAANAPPPDATVLNERPWPLPEPPDPDAGDGFHCRVYDGATAADLLALFETADHGARWDHGGTLHQILARSLLPREEPCQR